MKKLRRFLYIAAIALVVSVIAVFVAACSDKNSDNKPKQYTITFKLSEDVDYDSYTGLAGSDVVRNKPDPTDTTSKFEGWSLTLGGDIVDVPEKMPAKNVTYYAVFAKYYNVTLNVGSGTLSGQDKLEVKANQNLYSAVKNLVPTAAGDSVFDGWYYNNVKLTENSQEVMPEKRITLEAKYTIDYTVNVYVQKEFGKTGADDYELKTDKRVTGNGFVGASLSATAFPNDLVGYTIDEEKSGGANGYVLAAQNNVFNLYYGKTVCDIMFVANEPKGTTVIGTTANDQWGYGDTHYVPKCGYDIDGYRFSYWSTDINGKSKYYVGDEISVNTSTIIYAIWVKGYTDASELSTDIIFIDKTKNGTKVAYLQRVGFDEIIGNYNDSNNVFTFTDEKNNVSISGTAYSDANGNYFVYRRNDVYALQYMRPLDESDSNIDYVTSSDITLTLSVTDAALYKDGDTTINGTYSYDSQAQSLKFTSDEKTFYFRLNSAINATTGLHGSVFEIRGDEYGLYNYLDTFGEIDYNYNMFLDGYGNAQMVTFGIDLSDVNSYQTYVTDGIYRYSTAPDNGIYEITAEFYGDSQTKTFDCRLMSVELSDSVEYVYLERTYIAVGNTQITTIYANPTGNTFDPASSDKIVIDGFGGAKLTSDGIVTDGSYSLDMELGYIYFTPDNAQSVDDTVAYELLLSEINGMGYIIYEPVEEINGNYAISNLNNSLVAGRDFILHIYNNGAAEVQLRLIDQDPVFGNIYIHYDTLVSGSIVLLDDSEEYHFVSSESNVSSEYLAILLYGNVDLSVFNNFKFRITSLQNGTGRATGIGDGYDGIKVVYDDVTYTTDGFGRAVSQDGTVKNYTVGVKSGIECLQLEWSVGLYDHYQLYFHIDDAYMAVEKAYGLYNNDIMSPKLYMYLLSGSVNDENHQYAAISYVNNSESLYSYGIIEWEAGDKRTFGKYTVVGSIGNGAAGMDVHYGADFKFGIKDGYTNYFYLYDCNAVNIEGVSTISGAGGAQLVINRNDWTAEYRTPNSESEDGYDSVSSAFTYYKNIISITSGKTTLSFRLNYNTEETEIESFDIIGENSGVWQNYDGSDNYIYLSGEKNGDQKYIGIYSAGDVDYNGTYVRTDNTDYLEYIFTYQTTEDGDPTTVDMKFCIGYIADRPSYRLYTQKISGIYMYESLSSDVNEAIGFFDGGGYDDLYYVTAEGDQVGTLGVIQGVYPLNGYTFSAFLDDQGEIIFYFAMENPEAGAQYIRAFMLDSTVSYNHGYYSCEPYTVSLPAKTSQATTQITLTNMIFTGMGIVVLVDENDDMYMATYEASTSSTLDIFATDNTLLTSVQIHIADSNYSVVFVDDEMATTFSGSGFSLFVTDGFNEAMYVDEYGTVYYGYYGRSPEYPEVIVLIYYDGVFEQVIYIEVDTQEKTFERVRYDDQRLQVGA